MSRKPKQLLSEEDVIRLRGCRDVKVVPDLTPEQKLEKADRARKVRQSKSVEDLDVKIQRYTSWALQLCKKYGMSPDWYDLKLKEQQGLCAICNKPERARSNRGNETIRRLCVDHDHATGRARELLCHDCNGHLGYLENRDWRARAEAYLAKHKSVIFA